MIIVKCGTTELIVIADDDYYLHLKGNLGFLLACTP